MSNDGTGRDSPSEFRHVALDDIDSTNAECMRRAREGDPGGLWVTATLQTQGRARRGRSWVSEPGNLYASLLLIDPAPTEALSSLPLAVSLALYDAVRQVLPVDKILNIKWPNDLLVEGMKLSGILLEGEMLPNGKYALVIGCGVNIRHKPGETPYPATTLSENGSAVSAEELFARLYVSMADMLATWNKGRGMRAVVARWREVAAGMGGKITVNLPDRSIEGIFTDIDENGMLLLDRGGGNVISIAAGDVFFA